MESSLDTVFMAIIHVKYSFKTSTFLKHESSDELSWQPNDDSLICFQISCNFLIEGNM